ncbi:MAG: ATP-binding protein [Spirochaetes bacterium]|nr:ATP-binding protein [Spirochaetota bacterium]
MKQIVIISGKGGTGKTIITASLAVLAKNKIMADCDVDAADLHLLLQPDYKEKNIFKSGHTAKINKEKCNECGKCISACRFDAIDTDFIVDPISCEGCNVCKYVCPVNAITMEENISGEWYISETKYGTMVHANLGIAEENSGKLVTTVRNNANEIAKKTNADYIIIDGPPGIGCPVIASISGADIAVVVTEPTLSGISDMDRVIKVTKHFDVNTKVVVNKYDINLENTEKIEEYCKKNKIELVVKIPFSEKVSKSIVGGVPIVEYSNNEVGKQIISLWDKIK